MNRNRKFKAREAADSLNKAFLFSTRYRPPPRALQAYLVVGSWGSAPLDPRLYAIARYRGLA